MYTVARVWYDASSIWQAMLFGVGALCVGYVVASLLDIPLRWQVRFVGWSLGVLSLLYCLGVLLQGQLVGLFALFGSGSNAFGVVAVLVTLYSLGQWVMRGWARMGADGRGWYLFIKKKALPALARWSRTVLLFFRNQHLFFGWLVLVTATAHAFFFVPAMLGLPLQEVLNESGIATGLIAWGLLLCLVALGLWIAYAVRHKRRFQRLRLVHVIVALVFIAGFLLHIVLQ